MILKKLSLNCLKNSGYVIMVVYINIFNTETNRGLVP